MLKNRCFVRLYSLKCLIALQPWIGDIHARWHWKAEKISVGVTCECNLIQTCLHGLQEGNVLVSLYSRRMSISQPGSYWSSMETVADYPGITYSMGAHFTWPLFSETNHDEYIALLSRTLARVTDNSTVGPLIIPSLWCGVGDSNNFGTWFLKDSDR